MNIVIVGGGKLGYHLAISLLDKGYAVNLIEKDKIKCSYIADSLDAQVVLGDGTDLSILESANILNTDYFIAVTGRDQDNLVACQLAKYRFNVKKVIARVNNPENLEIFKSLGVNIAVSSTDIITNIIEQEIQITEIKLLAKLNEADANICSINIPHNSNIDGKQIKDINMPKSSLIVSIIREEKLIIPKGDTKIKDGDEIIAVCKKSGQKNLMKLLK